MILRIKNFRIFGDPVAKFTSVILLSCSAQFLGCSFCLVFFFLNYKSLGLQSNLQGTFLCLFLTFSVCVWFSVMTVKIFCAICIWTLVKFILKRNPQTCRQDCRKHVWDLLFFSQLRVRGALSSLWSFCWVPPPNLCAELGGHFCLIPNSWPA